MKSKKTLSNWLTNRFLLIIRNEENFAEKRTFSFTYAKIIVFTFVFIVLVFGLSFYMINTILAYWLNPKYARLEANNRIIILTEKVDSLAEEVRRKDVYILNFRSMLTGGSTTGSYDSSYSDKNEAQRNPDVDYLSPYDQDLRKEIENEPNEPYAVLPSNALKNNNLKLNIPSKGVLKGKFEGLKGNPGVDIIVKDKEIRSVANGSVIIINGNEITGYLVVIQHEGGFISEYYNNSKVLKEVGNFVKAGDVISEIDTKLKPGKDLHFELWHNGNPVNPQNFINFK
ncbi:MAG TPA: M23 family metallopeptidase [Cytophagaceae bacterium]|nr:M23 family metallopeptidase [Cytophagaceae bacterium]